MTGLTFSDNLPTHNAYQSALAGNLLVSDAFLVKLGPAGSTLLYCSYLGGPGNESGNGIALSGGYVYIAGETDSGSQFPRQNSFQNNAGGGLDGFVAKFDPSASGGASLLYSSWLGGPDDERATAIAVDTAGNAYVTGEAFSCGAFGRPPANCNPGTSRFPLVNALQPVFGGGDVEPLAEEFPTFVRHGVGVPGTARIPCVGYVTGGFDKMMKERIGRVLADVRSSSGKGSAARRTGLRGGTVDHRKQSSPSKRRSESALWNCVSG